MLEQMTGTTKSPTEGLTVGQTKVSGLPATRRPISMLVLVCVVFIATLWVRGLLNAGPADGSHNATDRLTATSQTRSAQMSDGIQLEELIRLHSDNPRSSDSETIATAVPPAKEAAGGPDADWKLFSRNDRDLGRLFALAPSGVSKEILVRHPHLNAADSYVAPADRKELDELLRLHKERIKDCDHSRSARQHEVMESLHARGELTRLDLERISPVERERVLQAAKDRRSACEKVGINSDSLEGSILDVLESEARSFIPDARAFRRGSDGLFVATSKQLEATQQHREYLYFLKYDFMLQVLAWFAKHGQVVPDALTKDVLEFERLMSRA